MIFLFGRPVNFSLALLKEKERERERERESHRHRHRDYRHHHVPSDLSKLQVDTKFLALHFVTQR